MKKTSFQPSDIKALEPEAKIGLIATVDPQGLPHISLLTSLRAKSPTQLTFGQFCEGRSKEYVKQNPKVGFLVLTMDKRLWRGRALWTHFTEGAGEDHDIYNSQPLFRYNAYFGIHTVHYLDLEETSGEEKLPLAGITASSMLTMAARSGAKSTSPEPVMKPWAQQLFNSLSALKFIGFVGDDGFPVLIPLIQCQASDSRTLVFSPLAYADELKSLASDQPVAVYGLTMQMESVLVRGRYAGVNRYRGIRLGRIDLDWVYNSMPPKQGQIYPEPELRPVVDF